MEEATKFDRDSTVATLDAISEELARAAAHLESGDVLGAAGALRRAFVALDPVVYAVEYVGEHGEDAEL